MTATTARTSTRSTPMLFSRQRQLLQLLDALGGTSGMLDFQKLLFLYCQDASTGEAPYDFVPYKFGAFSFTSYADRRKLIERGLLEDEDGWQITAEGQKIIGRTMDMQLVAFAKRHRGLHGDALVADTYRRFPFFATRSEIAERVLKGDDAALARIKAVRAKATGPALSSDRRCPEDESMTVRKAYEQEHEKLLKLPGDAFCCDERMAVNVGKTPYVRFDLNDYSVPATQVNKQQVVLADLQRVRIFDGTGEVASYPRSWNRRDVIEDPAHIEQPGLTSRAAAASSIIRDLQVPPLPSQRKLWLWRWRSLLASWWARVTVAASSTWTSKVTVSPLRGARIVVVLHSSVPMVLF